MKRTRLSLSIASLATLAACATYEPVTPAGQVVTTSPGAVVTTTPPSAAVVTQQPPAVVTAPQAVVTPGTAVVVPPAAGVRPGMGRVESNQRLSQASGPNPPVRRIAIRMDDGAVQFVDTQAQNVNVGDRVELTADNHIRYPIVGSR